MTTQPPQQPAPETALPELPAATRIDVQITPGYTVFVWAHTNEAMRAYARAALASYRAQQEEGRVGTVPWPTVTRYSGGAAPEGIAGRVWVRLADDGPEVEYVPAAPRPAQAVARAVKRFNLETREASIRIEPYPEHVPQPRQEYFLAPAEPPGREGLTDGRIWALWSSFGGWGASRSPSFHTIVRAVEKEHGIAPPTERGAAAHQPKEGDRP